LSKYIAAVTLSSLILPRFFARKEDHFVEQKERGLTPLFSLFFSACAGMTAGRIAFFAVDNLQRFRLETACG
jgi:hypothetical protein